MFTIPTVTFNFIKDNTDAELLAKPQLRIAEGEKAQLVIGDRVPIPVTTINTQQAVGSTGVDPDHVVPVPGRRHQDRHGAARPPQQGGVAQAHDRGLADHRLRHRERRHEAAHHRDAHDHVVDPPEGRRDELPRGPHPQGLVEDEEARFRSSATSRSSARSSRTRAREDKRTDLYLTLTPHIIRSPQITEEDLIPIWVGTENNVSFSGLNTRLESPNAPGSPFDAARRRAPAGAARGDARGPEPEPPDHRGSRRRATPFRPEPRRRPTPASRRAPSDLERARPRRRRKLSPSIRRARAGAADLSARLRAPRPARHHGLGGGPRAPPRGDVRRGRSGRGLRRERHGRLRPRGPRYARAHGRVGPRRRRGDGRRARPLAERRAAPRRSASTRTASPDARTCTSCAPPVRRDFPTASSRSWPCAGSPRDHARARHRRLGRDTGRGHAGAARRGGLPHGEIRS